MDTLAQHFFEVPEKLGYRDTHAVAVIAFFKTEKGEPRRNLVDLQSGGVWELFP